MVLKNTETRNYWWNHFLLIPKNLVCHLKFMGYTYFHKWTPPPPPHMFILSIVSFISSFPFHSISYYRLSLKLEPPGQGQSGSSREDVNTFPPPSPHTEPRNSHLTVVSRINPTHRKSRSLSAKWVGDLESCLYLISNISMILLVFKDGHGRWIFSWKLLFWILSGLQLFLIWVGNLD